MYHELDAPLIARDAFSSPQPLASTSQKLIVTPRLEFPATRRKQSPNPISNRYKMDFSMLPFRPSPQRLASSLRESYNEP